MTDDRFTTLLNEMANLLLENQKNDTWGLRLSALARKRTMHIDYFRSQILKMYGGMGSINDIYVRDQNGNPDSEKSDQFAKLSSELYDLIHTN